MTNNFISNETPIVGKLSIISMKGCEGITAKIDEYLRAFRGYEDTETYVTHVTCPRFGTGEGKCVIDETVRGHDVYIICDVFNYGVTYKMYGVENHMSPDAVSYTHLKGCVKIYRCADKVFFDIVP